MNVQLCDKRRSILDQGGHLLVLGGPGSGKTTIALLKAQRRCRDLEPGQELLFLSFSRAAVRQVLNRCKTILSAEDRRHIQVQTYHSFCLGMLESYGRMINGKQIRFLFPSEERIRKSEFLGDWEIERRRLSVEEGLYCFDLFAAGVATLLEGSAALRKLVADKYPMMIIDEFQDTDDDQWRLVHALAPVTNIFCLADPEQRIFEYRKNVDPQRLNLLRQLVRPAEFDLGGENHRSAAASGILRVANAVLHNRLPLPLTPDVKHLSYPPKAFDTVAHAAVAWTHQALRDKGIKEPCISVLCRTNSFVAKLSAILSEEHILNRGRIVPIDHDVVWDADLSAASAIVVGSILEWTSKPQNEAVATTLNAISNYYRLKNANHPSALATKHAHQYAEAAVMLTKGARLRIKAAKELVESFASNISLKGNPVEDWKMARQPLHDIAALDEIFREVRLVRLFRATDTLAAGLAELWLETGSYAGAVNLVKRVLDRERLVSADKDPEGCILMTIHKSKGKEFDGVVLVEGQFNSPFFSPSETPPFEQSRRLLRVAITRAKSLVTIVRPNGAQPLIG